MNVQKDAVVTIEYTLTDELGNVLDTSKGDEPLSYLHGNGNLIAGLEAALEGKSEGESLVVSIPPAEAYGEWQKEKLITVDHAQFQGVDELQVGMQFTASDGVNDHLVTVTKIDGNNVTVDLNHPLAGKTLKFDVAILGVRAATQEELQHGHVHGAGGHHH